jgi:hypothetical protein
VAVEGDELDLVRSCGVQMIPHVEPSVVTVAPFRRSPGD